MLSENFAESQLHARVPPHVRARNLVARFPLSAHVVLGRRLRPLAYWHVALLDWAESPFAGHHKQFTLAALDSAASLCRSVYPHSCLPRASTSRACLLQYRFGQRDRFARELGAFANYLRDYNSAPVFGQSPGGSEEAPAMKVPGYQLSVVQLMRNDSRLTLAQAWMTPLSFGAWSLTAHAQCAGDDLRAMLDDEDMEMFGLEEDLTTR